MINYEKTIKVDENRIMKYTISEGYIKPVYSLHEGFLQNGELKKGYSLSQWDDYGLNAWIEDDNESDIISFEFDVSHPLYIPFFHLLNYDEQLIIEDDGIKEYGKKYLHIYRNDNKMLIDFIDKINNNYMDWGERFHVFIKNIVFDGRSKIDCDKKDTKIRLHNFFKEINQILTKDCRQISLEDYYMENYEKDTFEEAKRIFKRKNN